MNISACAAQLHQLLGVTVAPVAVAFRPAAPAGVRRVATPSPAGCAYWKRAAHGEIFYTEAMDHDGCAVGAHTLGIDLPPEQAQELSTLVGKMIQLQYIGVEEVAALPRRTDPFHVAVYAPLAQAPCDPDVVLVRGNAKQVMLVAEAARAAGIGDEVAAMGRPACAMIPEVLRSAHGTTSLGCIGNRVYTELADDELYFAIPGPAIAEVVGKLDAIISANRELQQYHRSRAHGSDVSLEAGEFGRYSGSDETRPIQEM